ncbi:hypothetical protein J437_LFUL005776 [Ladona fulva]|uniref:Uncharacterized protein n=1 Tax=Ladona fulva TaxID=123851 RepID=A0A8K0K3Q6_LADFU|nr:hypothetical protein J437_LFUL005776 [Ladona fulva]
MSAQTVGCSDRIASSRFSPPQPGTHFIRTRKMPTLEDIGRRNNIPILYTRGTHYEVGYDVGRTFRGLIQSFLSISVPLNQVYLPLYETEDGIQAYEKTLTTCKENFPQYVRELQGIAEGAQVPFHKVSTASDLRSRE